MSAFGGGPSGEFSEDFTIVMNRIVVSPSGFGCRAGSPLSTGRGSELCCHVERGVAGSTGPANFFGCVLTWWKGYFFPICSLSLRWCSTASLAPKSSSSKICRISISLSSLCGLGQRLIHSIASAFDFTWMIQYPATSSLVSAKGPSITVRLSPENLTRAPFELACNPLPSSITPAFTISSLNFAMAESSSSVGILPVSESLVALTITMKRIVVFSSSLRFGAGLILALLCRRTKGSKIDRCVTFFLWHGHTRSVVYLIFGMTLYLYPPYAV